MALQSAPRTCLPLENSAQLAEIAMETVVYPGLKLNNNDPGKDGVTFSTFERSRSGQDEFGIGTEVAIQTESEHLGPCEPGSHLLLEGVVWHETQDGVLVVNITWRGRSYVGTLLDHTKYDWASASGYSEVNEEKRATKGRNTNNSNAAAAANLSSFKRNLQTNLSSSQNSSGSNSERSSQTSGNASGGRTTNNSIAAEYDANSKVRVHAVSPLVGNPSAPQVAINQQQAAPGPSTKPKRGSQSTPGNKTPPPVAIIEEQSSQNSSANSNTSTTSGVKRKSEKTSSASDSNAPSENKTGKKPRVTITNYGANNETLTTILNAPMTNTLSDSFWKCSEESCSKKYKHKNGLRYHVTHAHGKSEADADVIIENEMSAHLAALGTTVSTENSLHGDEDVSESNAAKLTSPKSKKTSTLRKSSTAKDKRKRRESDNSPSSSEQGSSNGATFEDGQLSVSNPSNETSDSCKVSSTIAKVSPKEEPTQNITGAKTKIARSNTLPLQGSDPASQPERKVAKVAPTTFAGSDALKLKQQGSGINGQPTDSSIKMEPMSSSGNTAQVKPFNSQPQNFHIQTPMYPYGPVDPNLYTNFVGSNYNMQGHSESSITPPETVLGIKTSSNSPKPEGTAARIVHQHLTPTGQAPWSQHPGGSSSAFNAVTQTRGNSGSTTTTTTTVNWQTTEGARVESSVTKFVEVNAQHIAESTADTVASIQQQQQQTSHSLVSTSVAPIASHHVHNHIHNYVGFPPPQILPQNPTNALMDPANISKPTSSTVVIPQPSQQMTQTPSTSIAVPPQPLSSSHLTALTGVQVPAMAMGVAASLNQPSNNAPPLGSSPLPSPQFASLVQGRPLAPILPFNSRGHKQ